MEEKFDSCSENVSRPLTCSSDTRPIAHVNGCISQLPRTSTHSANASILSTLLMVSHGNRTFSPHSHNGSRFRYNLPLDSPSQQYRRSSIRLVSHIILQSPQQRQQLDLASQSSISIPRFHLSSTPFPLLRVLRCPLLTSVSAIASVPINLSRLLPKPLCSTSITGSSGLYHSPLFFLRRPVVPSEYVENVSSAFKLDSRDFDGMGRVLA